MIIQPTAFKTYDIRGIVETELPIAALYDLGHAIARYFLHVDPTLSHIVVGRDGRTSSPAMSNKLIAGLVDAGLRIIDIGIAPTPVVYFAHYQLPTDAGIIITASHNPAQYNGVKIVLQHHTLYGPAIADLGRLYQEEITNKQSSGASCVPQTSKIEIRDMMPRYVEALQQEFIQLQGMARPLIIDCGNGATGNVIPAMVEQFQWSQTTLRATRIDGTFPDRNPNPTIEEYTHALRTGAAENHCLAIAFDGDGDRVVFIDEQGRQLTGDTTLAIIAAALARQQGPCTVVTDVKCSPTLQQWLTTQEVTVVQTPCGIAFIKQAMHEHQASFGGELSCHYCFTDRHQGYDDGIYTALRLLELLEAQQTTLAALVDQLPTRFTGQDLRIACPESTKKNAVQMVYEYYQKKPDAQLMTLDGVSVTLPYGSCNVRASNTESVLSVRIEGRTAQAYAELEQEVLQLITSLPL